MKKLVVGLLLMVSAPFASAVLIDAEVPDANILNDFNGLDWAWGGPCAWFNGCGDIDLSFQSARGWRMATPAEAALAPDRLDFVFAGAMGNFQFGTPPGAAACASEYFNASHDHCDWDNAPAGGNLDWSFGFAGEVGFAEALVVRGARAAVPEPGTLGLIGLGLLGLGMARRRKVA